METLYYFEKPEMIITKIYDDILNKKGRLIMGVDHYLENPDSLNSISGEKKEEKKRTRSTPVRTSNPISNRNRKERERLREIKLYYMRQQKQ